MTLLQCFLSGQIWRVGIGMSLFISVVIIFEIIHVYSGQVRVREKNETHNILLGGNGCGCWFSFVCLMLKLEKVA